MFRLWTRVTSGMNQPNRLASTSPAWGPDPVTMGPVTMSRHAAATANRDSVRSTGPMRARRGPGSWPARHSRTTASATRTMDSTKWPATAAGWRSTSTVMPPRTIWPTTPATSPRDSHTRSRRYGRRRSEPSTAAMTDSETSPVKRRLTCSMAWLTSPAAMNFSLEQLGQSSHPSPEPVSRTAAPETTMMHNRASATMTTRR